MAAVVVGAAAQRKRRLFIAAQIGLPAVLLLERIQTGLIEWYGWGWQMFS